MGAGFEHFRVKSSWGKGYVDNIFQLILDVLGMTPSLLLLRLILQTFCDKRMGKKTFDRAIFFGIFRKYCQRLVCSEYLSL